jgi:hypothetical protein
LGRRERQVIDTTRFESGHREMTWEYDAEGRVVRTTYDGWTSKGLFRETQIFYDPLGRRERLETTEDGAPSDRVKYVYVDGEPSIVEERHHDVADDSLEYGFRYQLAANRWLQRLEIFNAEIVQTAEIYSYEDVTTGKLSRRDLDLEADGIVEEVDDFFWDAEGRVVRAEYDTNGDGLIEDKIGFTYDAAGNLVLRTWDHPEHWVNYSTTFVWEDKRLLEVERTDDTSGASLERWSFEYGCPGNLPMDVNIAPIQGFRREMEVLPVEVDATKWWEET